MKTFREMISWELEQDKRQTRSLHITTEDGAGKIGSSMMRKLRYLSAGANGQRTGSTLKRA
jgi:hypothetical protein